jgi:ketosteroid isomerase-like protein
LRHPGGDARPSASKAVPMMKAVPLALLLVLLALADAPAARADDAADIRARLEQWTDDFNAGRADQVCDLFSKEAISNYRGQPERDYGEICGLLQKSLADPARDYRYQLDLREIIVEGDLAVVRLTWTLFISPLNVTSVEPGMDIFRKEADGKWRIVRYMAYEEDS